MKTTINTLRAVLTPALKCPDLLDIEDHDTLIIVRPAKADYPIICGKNALTLDALRTLWTALDGMDGKHPRKLILAEAHHRTGPLTRPSNKGEENALAVAKLIMAALDEPADVTAAEAGDIVYLLANGSFPTEVRLAISRWLQAISMSAGGRRVALATDTDVK